MGRGPIFWAQGGTQEKNLLGRGRTITFCCNFAKLSDKLGVNVVSCTVRMRETFRVCAVSYVFFRRLLSINIVKLLGFLRKNVYLVVT